LQTKHNPSLGQRHTKAAFGRFYFWFLAQRHNYLMPKDNELEQAVQDLIIDICEVMYARGYRTVPVGAIMRLIGVNAENASLHDQELFQLDEEFAQLIDHKPPRRVRPVTVPSGVTLH
jgi:hypothetical protein